MRRLLGSLSHLGGLTLEGARIARSQPISSVVTLLMALATCVAVLATTGQTAATEQQVLAGLDSVGSRIIVITDDEGRARIDPASVPAIDALDTVESVVGFGPVHDLRVPLPGSGPAGAPAGARELYGDLPAQLRVTRGRWEPGAALVGPQAMKTYGLTTPSGTLQDADHIDHAVTGSFRARGHLAFLNRGVILRPPTKQPGTVASSLGRESAVTLSQIQVRAKDVDDVDTLVKTLPGVVVADTRAFSVASPTELVKARKVVSSSLADSSRRLMLLVLAAALVLEVITMYGAVSGRRRDFGRRRALGASRSAISWLVLVQTLVPAVLGAALGSVAGVITVERTAGDGPPASFVLGVALLNVLAAAVAALLPALTAARRDPARILRVP